VKKKLERLLALAQLEAGGDESRQNEARNAAYTMVQLAKQHGFTIVFSGGPEAIPGKFQEFVNKGAADFVGEVFVPVAEQINLHVQAIREWNDPNTKQKWVAGAKSLHAQLLVMSGVFERCSDCKAHIGTGVLGFKVPDQRDFQSLFNGGFIFMHPNCMKQSIIRAMSNTAR
jgi:hypothetical protein